MKTFLAVFDVLEPYETTMQYAAEIACQTGAELQGLFLASPYSREFGIYERLIGNTQTEELLLKEMCETEDENMQEAIDSFRSTCASLLVPCREYRCQGPALQEVLQKSLFADLLILSRMQWWEYWRGPSPGGFLRHLLAESPCPVFICADKFRTFSKPYFLFDGSPSAFFAVKAFHACFPSFEDAAWVQAQTRQEGQRMDSQLQEDTETWMTGLYPNGQKIHLQGGSREVLNFIQGLEEDAVVVAGSYGRSEWSMQFHKSTADPILSLTDFPLFIAHR